MNYVAGKAIQVSSAWRPRASAEEVFLGPSSTSPPVQILERERPHHRPAFVPDPAGSSETGEVPCREQQADPRAARRGDLRLPPRPQGRRRGQDHKGEPRRRCSRPSATSASSSWSTAGVPHLSWSSPSGPPPGAASPGSPVGLLFQTGLVETFLH